MKQILSELEEKRQQLKLAKPFRWGRLKGMGEWFGNELTYSSNALEGNTLSRAETALVVTKGLAVEGKTLREHLEAVNHARAYEWVERMVGVKGGEITEEKILELHRLILQSIDDSSAGRYRTGSVRIAGSRVIMPNALKVPRLMEELVKWLVQKQNANPVEVAVETHLRLVSIHPFADGNGRVARLLMNWLLMQAGYPPAIIEKEERKKYIESLEKIQLGGASAEYEKLMYEAVKRSLRLCEEGKEEVKGVQELGTRELLKIGEVARMAGETVPTIRHWTHEGLLKVDKYTQGGYQLYEQGEVQVAVKVRRLQKEKRLTLKEIKQELRK
ncbi:MAG: Fic family protein [bacterium]